MNRKVHMIRIEKALTQLVPSDLYMIGAPKDVLFFDIETTGLSARSAGLYLIGVLAYTDKSWTLLQFFCEDVADEPAVLQAFFELLHTKKILVSYNGDGFDIPFLRHMLEQYGLPYSFDAVESFDLFKKFRPLKRLLGLPDLKLKSCERFLGIDREDRFTGGELIEIYFEWQKTKAPALLDTLLLHNAEDIANLPNLLPLLRYRALPHSDFQLRAHERLQDGATPLVHLSFTLLPPMSPSAHAPAESDERKVMDAHGPHCPDAGENGTREMTDARRQHCPDTRENDDREVMDARHQHWPEHALPQPMDLRGDFWALHAEGSAVELYVQLFEGSGSSSSRTSSTTTIFRRRTR